MHIGDNIIRVREHLGVSRAELAAKLKLRVKTVAAIERSGHLSEIGLRKIAEALQVSPDTLWRGELLLQRMPALYPVPERERSADGGG